MYPLMIPYYIQLRNGRWVENPNSSPPFCLAPNCLGRRYYLKVRHRWSYGCCKWCSRSIAGINTNKIKDINGTKNFGYTGDPIRDERLHKWYSDKAKLQVKQGRSAFSYNGDPEHDSKVREMDHNNGRRRMIYLHKGTPKCELNTAKFLNSINIKYIHNYRNKDLFKRDFSIDFYLPEFNIGIELHGGYKYNESNILNQYAIDRSGLIENKGIKLIHIKWDKVINLNKDILFELINKAKSPQRLECELVEFK